MRCKTMGFACLALVLGVASQGCSMTPTDNQLRVEIHEDLTDWKANMLRSELEELSEDRAAGRVASVSHLTTPGKIIFIVDGVKDVRAYVGKIKFARVVEFREAERTVVISTIR